MKAGSRITDLTTRLFTRFLPQPFAIAVILTLLVMLLALAMKPDQVSVAGHSRQVLLWWQQGLFSTAGLEFAMQMMLMLVLGHILALTAPVSRLINRLSALCTNSARAAFIVTFTTMLVALFNWGLGLIYGAILARKVGEFAARNRTPLNYPLIGAAGYSGMMIWHAGLSGSALVKVAEPGALQAMMTGSALSPSDMMALPNSIPLNETMFSWLNVGVVLASLICFPLVMRRVGARRSGTLHPLPMTEEVDEPVSTGATTVDTSRWFSVAFGVLMLAAALLLARDYLDTQADLGFITPNFINLALLGAGLMLHKGFNRFLQALEKAIGGCTGILIQFPLYFGIMAVMKQSGMIAELSTAFTSISSPDSYPFLTFVSAGITNIMVPSGGGQWAVQGPIVIEGAMHLGVPLHKAVLSLAYGDQLTNMMQPFWALPLLGITGLSARAILPYTLLIMGLGAVIFSAALWLL
jgi:short-chain fatty acids transporter